MPELPEAETIKRVIEPQIQGLMIKNVIVNRPEAVSYTHLAARSVRSMRRSSQTVPGSPQPLSRSQKAPRSQRCV